MWGMDTYGARRTLFGYGGGYPGSVWTTGGAPALGGEDLYARRPTSTLGTGVLAGAATPPGQLSPGAAAAAKPFAPQLPGAPVQGAAGTDTTTKRRQFGPFAAPGG